ncbi:ribonuclease domain-containing protein [Streptomyces sp. NPDC005728]|uniref:ribonuclease domain-containing protein n=1 Tax=Streptomyces sp. NPDC005728 TaxID=3157054 RepID=UPI0033FD1D31
MLLRFVLSPFPRRVPRASAGLLVRLGVVLSVLLSAVLTGCSSSSGPDASRPAAATASAPAWAHGMATVPVSRLPVEARRTLALIDKGGPFPYARDGIVFGNFEGLLPERGRGYYHEYTVKTPSASGRGARRIITGQGGEIYYTDDHYKSFRAVLR